MKNVLMLAVAIAFAGGTALCGQEAPLEPIPLPTPLGKADNALSGDQLSAVPANPGVPLEGPVFPEGSVIVDGTPSAPIEVETYYPPPAVGSEPQVLYESAPGEVVVAPENTQVPGTHYYAVPQNPGVVYEQPYYRTYPAYAGGVDVAVYRSPFGRVGVTRVAPASYSVDIRIPTAPMVPFGVYRAGYPPMRHFAPMMRMPGPLPFMPGRPIRNRIRSMMW